MKILHSPFLQTLFSMLLVFSLTGCGSAAGPTEPVQPLVTAAGQKDAAQPGASLPGVISSETANGFPSSGSEDTLLLLEQELEPITTGNIQRLSLLAHFSEGGLGEEMAISPDGKFLALAANGGVVLYDGLTAEWLDIYSTRSSVTSLAFSPDGQKLAYFSDIPSGENYNDADPDFSGREILKPQLTMRSIPEGIILYELLLKGRGCGEYNADSLTFSPDGKRILFHDSFGLNGYPSTGSICVLDAENGALLHTIKPEKPWRVRGITPPLLDGKSVWALSVDNSRAEEAGILLNQLRKYNLENGALEIQLDLPEFENFLRLSPNQEWMVLGGKTAQIRSSGDGSLAAEIQVEVQSAQDNNKFSAARFSPDGSTLALGEWDGSVSLYSVPAGQLIGKLGAEEINSTLVEYETKHVLDLVFSSDGSILYSLLNSYFVDTPEIVRALRLADRQEIFRLSGRNTVDRRPSLSPDDALLAWGGYEDGSVQVWSTANEKIRYILKGHTATVLQTLFSPDGSQLATASMDGTVRLWHTVDGTPQATFEAHPGGVWSIGYTDDGSRLVSVGRDGLLKLWNPADGSLLKTLATGTGEWQVNSVFLTMDERAVMVVSGCIYPLTCPAAGAGDLRRIDLESGQITTAIAEGIQDISLSLDQSAFAAVFASGGMESGQIVSDEYPLSHSYTSPFGNGRLLGAAISPDGSLFLSGNSFGIHGWDAGSGQMIALVQDRSAVGNYGTIQFTPDGKIVLVAGATSSDGVIYLWGVRSQ